MKTLIASILTAALLAACSDDTARTTATTAPATTRAPAEAPAAPAATDDMGSMPMPGANNAAAGTLANGVGTVESVDEAAGKIVIAHGPIDAVKWPAMTMGFSATPEQMTSVTPGQKVSFEFNSNGPANTLTRIEPAQ